MADVKKADLTSMDIPEDKMRQLKQVFPEVFTEGLKVDLDKLKQVLGENVDAGKERFGMKWPGKADCFKIIQAPSVATLIPEKDESVNFDTSDNLFIEGDNLEVLKLLQKSYYGKIKMIYIDPPYNTGKDFIYPDNYSESLDTYLRYSGQIDAQGRKYSTNFEGDGRFHSKWLSMMYPRLYLARNLLRDEGVIFISIDDNEASNLRKLCDEIFGEENLLSIHHIQVRYGNKSLNERKDFQELIEYVFIYAKDKTCARFKKPFEEYPVEKFNLEIKHNPVPSKTVVENGRKVDIWVSDSYSIEKVDSAFDKFKETWISGSILTGTGHGTMYTNIIDKRRQEDGDGCLYRIHGIGEDGLGYRYYTNPKKENADRGKMYTKIPLKIIEELKSGPANKENPIINFYDYSADFGNIRHEGNMPFNGGKKPVKMLIQLMNYIDDKEFIVLDFFAGSGSTAHACLQLNSEDNGMRKFIMVQLPEQINADDKVLQEIAVKELNALPTISTIAKERIRRAIKKIQKDQAAVEKKGKTLFDDEKNIAFQDLGFKGFKLAQSNFKVWDGDAESKKEAVEKQLEMHVDHINPKSSQEDILFELLLKAGFELTTKIEKVSMVGKTVYSIEGGLMLICLEKELTKEVIKAMAEKNPSRVICLDEGFAGNDQLKTNAVQIMKSKGVEDFRTV